MSFSQKVNRLLKETGMTKAALAKESGLPYTTLDSMLKRETDTQRLAAVFRMARALGTSVESLVFDEEDPAAVSEEEKRILDLYSLLDSRGKDTVLSLLESQAGYTEKKEQSIPLYHAPAAAGSPLPVLTQEVSRLPYEAGQIPEKADFAVKISGNSMEPTLSDGDLVYLQRSETIENGEIGVFLLNGEILCKKYVVENGQASLASLNSDYAPIRILDTDEMKLFGKVLLKS